MTTAQQAGGASPVDFAAFGDYGDFRRKQPQPATGEFGAAAYPFRGRITADGSSGYPAVAGRYHLYISWACPWAHRTAIVRKLLGLQGAISLSAVDRVRDGRGWAFREGPGHSLDPVTGCCCARPTRRPSPATTGTSPSPCCGTGRPAGSSAATSPASRSTWTPSSARSPTARTCTPQALRPEIDAINAVVYETVNNGVYRSGMATS